MRRRVRAGPFPESSSGSSPAGVISRELPCWVVMGSAMDEMSAILTVCFRRATAVRSLFSPRITWLTVPPWVAPALTPLL